jgi:hypothetical protein
VSVVARGVTIRQFAVTFDYRCPFARIAHDHVVTGLQGGASWDVRFLAFSLGQAHVESGQPDIWDRPDDDSGLLALQVGVAVRDRWPAEFLAVHDGLFALRHDHAGDLRDRAELSKVLCNAGLDPDDVFGEVERGAPLATIRDEHTSFVASHNVWGVPTFVAADKAVFVRVLDRAAGDAELATTTIERILDQIDWPLLNEFKHTSIPR